MQRTSQSDGHTQILEFEASTGGLVLNSALIFGEEVANSKSMYPSIYPHCRLICGDTRDKHDETI